MIGMHHLLLTLCGCVVFFPGPPGWAQDMELDQHNLEDWRDHILPCDSDLTWLQIPWLTTYADGIRAADHADKPLLLWTMNGHPLGCT